MIPFDFLIAIALIITITLLSGTKIMINSKYTQLISFIIIMYPQLLNFIEGYNLGYIGITNIIAIFAVFLLIFIWGYRRNRYKYVIHNVEEQDVRNIIENYLDRKSMKYEVRNEEINLADFNNSIYVRSSIETTLDCREIKHTNFYNELVDEVKVGIKNIKRRYFSMEGVLYLIFTLFLIWVRFTFFSKIFR